MSKRKQNNVGPELCNLLDCLHPVSCLTTNFPSRMSHQQCAEHAADDLILLGNKIRKWYGPAPERASIIAPACQRKRPLQTPLLAESPARAAPGPRKQVQSTENNGLRRPRDGAAQLRRLSKQNAPTEIPEPAPWCPCQEKVAAFFATGKGSRESPRLKNGRRTVSSNMPMPDAASRWEK